MSPGYKWPFFQHQKTFYTKNSGQPALKGANSHHKFSIVLLFQKVPDSSQTSTGRLFIPIGNGKLVRGGRPRGTPIADTRTLFSRQQGGGQRGFMTACSTRSFFQHEKKKRLREVKKARKERMPEPGAWRDV